jgi:hypothetical protein
MPVTASPPFYLDKERWAMSIGSDMLCESVRALVRHDFGAFQLESKSSRLALGGTVRTRCSK